jgi:hypothetical protein
MPTSAGDDLPSRPTTAALWRHRPGLAAGQELIELHDGSLVIESKLGLGTRIVARFPASRVIAVVESPAANVIPLVRAS